MIPVMQETDFLLLIYGLVVGLVAGGVGGILAALAGVGGGLIYVPVFYTLMPQAGEAIAMPVLASMLAVVLTGSFSARSHYRLGHIDMPGSRQLIPGLVIGAGLGLWTTLHVPEALVLLGLAGLDLWVAFDYGRDLKPVKQASATRLCIALSGPVGYISGLLGIGSGTMLVPLLRRSLPLRMAVGTSAFCGVWMAGCGVALNLLLELNWQSPLQQQAMFLTGALLGMLIILPKTTVWAVALHDLLEESALRMILKALFFALAAALGTAAAVTLL